MDIGVQGMGENGSVVVDGAGSTLYLTVGSGSTGLTVGDGATGAMLVSNMALVDLGGADLVVGEQSGNYGNLTVDNGTVQNVGNFTAGDNGIGNVTVDDGGNLSAAMIVVGNQTGSVGNLTVTGTGSIVSSMGYPVDVGLNGNATMQILANGTVDNDHAYSYVGYAANGTVTVDHGTWENIGTLFVGAGSGGTGSVTVQNGGSVGAFAYDVGSATGSVGNMTVTGTGSVATVTDSGGVATVGDNGNGTLLISSNGTFDNGATPATLGNNLGVNGSATVDDGTWKNITTLTVGEAGNGSVLVDDAATVTASTLVAGDQNGSLGNIDITGPNTTVTMDGTGSATLIGNAGSANMSVTDFAILDNGGQDAQIGADATGSGNVSVSGGGQWKNVGDITVGYDGTGTLTVTSSGSLTADNIFLGYDGASSSGLVTVSGANTTVGVTGYIEVGANGPGEFDIKNGANVTAGYVTLADDVGGPGNMTVDGTNSKLQVTNTLEVGEDDLGNLTISGGANVTVGSDTEIGGQSTGTGNVDVTGDNSVLTTNGLLVGTFGNGTLTVENGGVVTVTPGNSIAFTLAGGTGTVNVGSAGMLQVGGTDGIDPGSGTSTFNMLGGTVQVIGSDFSTAINATLAASTTSIIDTNGLNATWAGNIAGGGKLSKYGIGTLTLSGVDTYTGCTTVTLGRLDVTGSLVSVVSVSSGATLGGNGTASNSVTLATGASVAPGYGGPSLTLGNLTWGGSMNGTATAFFTLSDVDSTASLLTVLGNFAKGAGTTFKFNFDGTGTGSTASPVQYTLISFGTLFDAGNGTFLISDFSYQDLGSGPNESGTFAYSGNNLTFTVVPEPGMGAMVVGLVVMGVGLVKRRRR
jgi:T5SS/PEP-CTERM-associated repeat protein